MGSCGDDTRNVTGCPLAGIDAHELVDASPLAYEITRELVAPRVLQPAAQVQDLDQRLRRVVRVSGDQRRRGDGRPARERRDRIFTARRRRAVE
jgi:hypothetical protein